MATKIQLEAELLMVEHDIKFNRNNKNAFKFSASVNEDAVKKASLIVTAAYYENREAEAENKADHLRNQIADFS